MVGWQTESDLGSICNSCDVLYDIRYTMTAIYSLVIEWNRTHWSSTGSSVGMGSPQSEKLTLKRKRHHADQTTNTKYKEDMRVQIFAVYVITTAISARSQWPFSIKLSWQNIFSFLTGSYVAKTGKMSLCLDSQRWISIKPPFYKFWANLVSFCSCNYLKNALCLQRIPYAIYKRLWT